MVDAAERSGNREVLQQVVASATETAERYDHRLYLGIAQRAWGLLHLLEGEMDQAAERLESAYRHFKDLRANWQLGRTLIRMGELAEKAGRRAEAAERAREAQALFKGIQAADDLQRAISMIERLSSASQVP